MNERTANGLTPKVHHVEAADRDDEAQERDTHNKQFNKRPGKGGGWLMQPPPISWY